MSDSLRPHESQQASLSITNSRSSPRLTSIESVMPSSHLILCHPLLLPPIPPSIRVFSNRSTLRMRWPEYWSFSFSIIPSKEIPGLISFRMDWLDLLAVQGVQGISIENSELEGYAGSSFSMLQNCSSVYTTSSRVEVSIMSYPCQCLSSSDFFKLFDRLRGVKESHCYFTLHFPPFLLNLNFCSSI